jgi:hypothetical protein
VPVSAKLKSFSRSQVHSILEQSRSKKQLVKPLNSQEQNEIAQESSSVDSADLLYHNSSSESPLQSPGPV